MTIAPNTSNGGLLFIWRSFGPQELARFDRLRQHGSRDEKSIPVTSGIRAIGCEGTVGMLKEEFEKRWARKSVPLRVMLSVVKERVDELEESMADAKELYNALGESIDDLEEQSRDFLTMCFNFNRDNVQELLDSQRKKLTKRNDALKAMVMALKEETMATTMALSTRIKELKGELALCRTIMVEGVSSAVFTYEDVPKPNEFVGTRSTCNVDNFLWKMENYFRAKDITDDAINMNTALMFLTNIVLL
ncbi:hypothetical protein PVK06_004032 [Gossypium arboreum]|uniref:Uncharacterized protein n=1 Tax=Gossypium arboreum TaxID=29729 RepID=A0ABR0QRA2_GOSAR|nr:hypothetical protein PVK06_004032 [Gossypium arboreum]